LSVLVLVHELGHFFAAKKNDIRVNEFGLGFPPKLWGTTKGETEYTLNLLPLGGFVKIFGENGEGDEDPRSFTSKSPGARATVIVAGVVCNLIFAWFLLSLGFMLGMPVNAGSIPEELNASNRKTIIIDVQKDTPAAEASLRRQDQILEFSDNNGVVLDNPSMAQIQDFVKEHRGEEIKIIYRRNGDIATSNIIPSLETKRGKSSLGIAMEEIATVRFPWYQAIWKGFTSTFAMAGAFFSALYGLILGAIKGLVGFDQILGPVGIANATGAAAQFGFAYMLGFAAMLSINLAVVNILPFPALDGGRLIFIFIEKLRGKPLSEKFTQIVHGTGFLILILLMVLITYQDIMKLI